MEGWFNSELEALCRLATDEAYTRDYNERGKLSKEEVREKIK